MKVFTLSFFVATTVAFPAVLEQLAKRDPDAAAAFERRSVIHVQKRADNVTQAISQAQTNCGPRPCLVFDAEAQYVSTHGDHEYRDPGNGDRRGPCPGLNAASNHNYLPRNGIATIPQTVTGLGAAYGLSAELSAALAAYAIAITGDPLTGTWSIGGPLPVSLPLLGRGQGISRSHNKYEGDTSIARQDAYLNNGDADSLIIERFISAYETRGPEDRITLDKFRVISSERQYYSVRNNPYYFSPLFSTAVVAPAAHNFIINFMSNHTAEEPSGYLNGEMFKTFFAVEGEYPNFRWLPGKERIPENWYRRTLTNPYLAADVAVDLAIGWAAYPNTFRLGGNINGVNTYRGLDIATITGGQYTFDGLLQGNNLACLIFQSQQQAIPDALVGLPQLLRPVTDLLNTHIGPIIRNLGCPQLEAFDQDWADQFPGSKYNP